MIKFNKVLIIGVGLIGGSIGLALKKRALAKEVVGLLRRKGSINKAIKCGAIDRGSLSLKDSVEGVDLAVVCTPASVVSDYASKTLSLNPNCIVTDAASTKFEILKNISGIKHRNRFIGSHPMAGSEKSGVEFARAELFENAVSIITPLPWTDPNALKRVVMFWKLLGCRIKTVDPLEHDRLVALYSHLPHIVATVLVACASEKDSWVISTGFRDTTRIASADPLMWQSICATNKRYILNSLQKFEKQFKSVKKMIDKDRWGALYKFFERIRDKRGSALYHK
jgi:prephenate dehydrogenase